MSILYSSEFLQPWLTLYPMSGLISNGGESIISLSFDSSELLEGVYTGSLDLRSNDPDDMSITIPISMDINGDSDCNSAGDLNEDGDASILDIILEINCILYEDCPDCADLNEDGLINIQDIIILINIILR